MPRVREVRARKILGRKIVRGKEYTFEYFTLPINIYLPKSMIEKWGTAFILELDEESGTIIIRPKKQYLERGIKPS